MAASKSKYSRIIERIFLDRYKPGATQLAFARSDITRAAKALRLTPPKNLGDVIYSIRYRSDFPESVTRTAPQGSEWTIRGSGHGRYSFVLVPVTEVFPSPGRYQIKIPDATPQIVAQHALTDEQAVLAKVRYNRLIDVFTGIVTYSLQNHLRTSVTGIGQLEIDELYVGVSKSGAQFIIPVQAKGGRDRVGRVQLEQDLAFCRSRFPRLQCRPIAAQAVADDVIVLFELTVDKEQRVCILDERHYKLTPADEISDEDLRTMRESD